MREIAVFCRQIQTPAQDGYCNLKHHPAMNLTFKNTFAAVKEIAAATGEIVPFASVEIGDTEFTAGIYNNDSGFFLSLHCDPSDAAFVANKAAQGNPARFLEFTGAVLDAAGGEFKLESAAIRTETCILLKDSCLRLLAAPAKSKARRAA